MQLDTAKKTVTIHPDEECCHDHGPLSALEPGERLAALGGIAALLRYKLAK